MKYNSNSELRSIEGISLPLTAVYCTLLYLDGGTSNCISHYNPVALSNSQSYSYTLVHFHWGSVLVSRIYLSPSSAAATTEIISTPTCSVTGRGVHTSSTATSFRKCDKFSVAPCLTCFTYNTLRICLLLSTEISSYMRIAEVGGVDLGHISLRKMP